MKKVNVLMLSLLLLFSCSNATNKRDLYNKQLSTLLDNSYQISDSVPFDIETNVLQVEEKYRVQIMFLNAQSELNDFTTILLDSRIETTKDAPINVGFFSDSINLVKSKEKTGDQTKIRFTFYSDIESPTMECAVSYDESNTRVELFFIIDVE
ncbi:MAG: hypothetical protein J1F32_04915 [Erysipelotrichales bacterium]|nr:hypothetical protein [Erysipelotrichales bacterium]